MNIRQLSLLALTPFILSACGDGWEMVLTKDVFPYGNARTAGSGVMYVRKHLAPPKEMKLESAQEMKEKVMEPSTAEPVESIEAMAEKKPMVESKPMVEKPMQAPDIMMESKSSQALQDNFNAAQRK